ncbi:MAG: SapC family protein [Leptothrix sp. (in: b-proteobacteria)]
MTDSNTPDLTPAAEAAAPVPAAASSAAGLFRQVVLLDRQRHAGKRLKPTQNWLAAREVNAVGLVLAEFGDAAREFPIAFVRADDGTDPAQVRIAPVALLGLRERQNLFVTAEGRWDGRYLPAYLRRYPFAYVRTDAERLSLAIDEACEDLSDTDGEPLLTPEGEASPHLKSVLTFLDRYEEDLRRSEAFCARLVALDLLRGAEIKGDLANGEKINAAGFYMVDEAKLAQLPDAEVVALHRGGMLGLIYTHLISMGQIQVLAQRMGAR